MGFTAVFIKMVELITTYISLMKLSQSDERKILLSTHLLCKLFLISSLK